MGWNNRATTEDYHAIDVRQWKREGWLDGARRFKTTWTCNGQETGSINVQTFPERVVLSYQVRGHGGEWEDLRYAVPLARTPCHFGGSRVWFRCPKCGRRVAILYSGKYFLCRHCHRLPYRSQGENQLDRTMRRANHYFDRIRSDNHRMWLEKPKGMRWKTYWRWYDKGMAEMRKARVMAAGKWGSLGSGAVVDATPVTPYKR